MRSQILSWSKSTVSHPSQASQADLYQQSILLKLFKAAGKPQGTLNPPSRTGQRAAALLTPTILLWEPALACETCGTINCIRTFSSFVPREK